ncbi:MAG: methylenetetrahydrofolate reductase, partial [Desulfocapsaceae bacterium]|nr:methylenetetrahydrofolate reductase [Desulfocapsaceae bacterium]
NRMALQGDLLAAHVLGIQNVLVTHSEDISQSDHRDAKEVFDLDETELIQAVAALNKGKDLGGFELDGIPDFTMGCTTAPCADEAALDQEIAAAAAKVDAGASFLITPPVFDLDTFAAFMKKVQTLKVPVIPTVFLIKSLAIAQYIVNSEPGANIPDELIRRIRKSSDREREGIKIAGETVAALKEMTNGVLLQTLGWEHRLPEILDIAGL